MDEPNEQLKWKIFEHCLGAGNPTFELVERGSFPANWVSRYGSLVEKRQVSGETERTGRERSSPLCTLPPFALKTAMIHGAGHRLVKTPPPSVRSGKFADAAN